MVTAAVSLRHVAGNHCSADDIFTVSESRVLSPQPAVAPEASIDVAGGAGSSAASVVLTHVQTLFRARTCPNRGWITRYPVTDNYLL